MSPTVALLGVVMLLGVATVTGLLLRSKAARGGRVREVRGEDRLFPAAFGTISFGATGTIVQFSTEYCSRCPGVRRVLSELSSNRSGLEFVHVDLTHNPALATRFSVLQTPTVLLLDGEGRPRVHLSGQLSQSRLSQAIDTLTGGTP